MLISTVKDGRKLSEFLTSEFSDIGNKYRHRISYEGDDLVDGLHCYRLRRDRITGDNDKVKGTSRIWLARDRNLLPVRSSWEPPSRQSDKLPTGICTVTTLQELEPGIWIPMRWRDTAYNGSRKVGLVENRMIENWRKDFQVESIRLNPEVDPQLFETVTVPQGTKIHIRDENGNHLGERIQPADGNISISENEFEKLRAP